MKVTLPDSLKTVRLSAFSGCKNLTDVQYAGSTEDRTYITMEGENLPLIDAEWEYLGGEGEKVVEKESFKHKEVESESSFNGPLVYGIVFVAIVAFFVMLLRKKSKA